MVLILFDFKANRYYYVQMKEKEKNWLEIKNFNEQQVWHGASRRASLNEFGLSFN